MDEQLKLHENTSDVKFEEISVRIDYDDGAVARTLETLVSIRLLIRNSVRVKRYAD